MIKSTFDDARSQFEDGTIDLLHIDGYHSYESVKHDFESWLPKMSSRGVILFHNINVRVPGFGVWKLWEEIKLTYPHFEFAHEHGLGVMSTNARVPQGLRKLLGLSDLEKHIIRDFFCQLGQRLRTRLEMDQGIQARDARIAGLEVEVSTSRIESQHAATLNESLRAQAASLNESLRTQVASLNESLRAQMEHNGKVVSTFESAFNALKAKAEESKGTIDERDRSIARLQHELAELSQAQQEVFRLTNSLSTQNKTMESLQNDLSQRETKRFSHSQGSSTSKLRPSNSRLVNWRIPSS